VGPIIEYTLTGFTGGMTAGAAFSNKHAYKYFCQYFIYAKYTQKQISPTKRLVLFPRNKFLLQVTGDFKYPMDLMVLWSYNSKRSLFFTSVSTQYIRF